MKQNSKRIDFILKFIIVAFFCHIHCKTRAQRNNLRMIIDGMMAFGDGDFGREMHKPSSLTL
jgi:hypothetical protein